MKYLLMYFFSGNHLNFHKNRIVSAVCSRARIKGWSADSVSVFSSYQVTISCTLVSNQLVSHGEIM